MRLVSLLLFLCSLGAHPCQSQEKFGPPLKEVATLEKDFTTWWAYQYWKINLARSDYQALNVDGKPIPKADFLEQLSTGSYIPIQLEKTSAQLYYQLFELSSEAKPSIVKTMSNLGLKSLNRYDLEESPFPNFSITDLNGKLYTNESIKGKTVLIKTWFIGCRACVAEFPDLNKMVEEHKDREDLVFLSLALDTPQKLASFLEKRPFAYATAGSQEALLKLLKVREYPTHFIIGPDGKIKKIVSHAHQLIELVSAF